MLGWVNPGNGDLMRWRLLGRFAYDSAINYGGDPFNGSMPRTYLNQHGFYEHLRLRFP
jgi:hypothetical protein